MSDADRLAQYNSMRDFTRTREPRGTSAHSRTQSVPGERMFVVQKHAASHLHWDLRLEMDGVLKSWAVTKGPSIDPDAKRLAVRTEDHPIDYAGFEGTIARQLYGGGTVMIWDRGTWQACGGEAERDLEKGHLRFTLQGERMNGEWLLVRLKPRKGERRENWLLRKLDDDHAGIGDVLVERELTSIATGRTMTEIASGAKAAPPLAKPGDRPSVKARRKRGLPQFRPPQLATLVDHVPPGKDWLHEIKFDGYRALVSALGEKVRIHTRSGRNWTARFTPIAEAIAGLELPACLLDGEIVAVDDDGNPDFALLQQLLNAEAGGPASLERLRFHAFDLLELDGEDLAPLSNLVRKHRLAELLSRARAPVHVADHVVGSGENLFRAMCAAGQEGIISKRVEGRYAAGRSTNWLKVKCTRRQDFVVIGWKASSSAARTRARFAPTSTPTPPP